MVKTQEAWGSMATVLIMPSQRRYLTTAELARALAVSTAAVQEWRRKGYITPELLTAGGQARWDETNVREQLRQRNEELRQQRERAEWGDDE
jgi:hypothetical protein